MIHTSYFSKYKEDNGVCIALGANWWKGERAPELAPSPKLIYWYKSSIANINTLEDKEYANLQKLRVEEVYKQKYLEQLSLLNPAEIYAKYDGKVLLCFERPVDFCHRHILAEWLRNAGFKCEELLIL
jgi:hypothetical protein